MVYYALGVVESSSFIGRIIMSALQKVAWLELTVSLLSIALFLALYPWLGQAAASGFAVLGLLGIAPFFLRKRDDQVVVDERDRQIERQASWFGFGTAWTLLLLSLVSITMWHSHRGLDVPTAILSILIWIQFALCYAIKGATTLFQYRGMNRAA